ncbi:MAG: hypothetical protein ACOC92_01695 [bacterium]
MPDVQDPARPTSWEDQPVFREHFLVHAPPRVAGALRDAGRHLFEACFRLDSPEPGEPRVHTRVRALAEDLRSVSDVLASLAAERDQVTLDPEEMSLVLRSTAWAREVREIAGAIEGSLGSPQEER